MMCYNFYLRLKHLGIHFSDNYNDNTVKHALQLCVFSRFFFRKIIEYQGRLTYAVYIYKKCDIFYKNSREWSLSKNYCVHI